MKGSVIGVTWKGWILLIISLTVAGMRWQRLVLLEQQLYLQLDRWVQVRMVPERWGGGRLSHMWMEGRWRSVDVFSIRFHSPKRCASAQARVFIGQLTLRKPFWGWNADPYRSWVDRPQFQFRCVGWGVDPTQDPVQRPGWIRVKDKLQAQLQTHIAPGWGGDILYSLVTGDHRRVTPELRQYLQLSFIWHMCVVSGMHVVMVFGVLLWIWKWISLPLRRRFALWTVSVDVWVRWMIAAFFLGWWGCEPSSLRGIGFYFAAHYWGGSDAWTEKLWRVSMVILVLISIQPMLVSQVGFWMSVYASVCFAWIVQNLKFLKVIGQSFWAAILMNLIMMPWILYLSGVVLWPWLVLSPIAVLQALVAMGCAGLQSIFPRTQILQQGVEGFMRLSLEWSYRAPAQFFVTGFLSEEGLWVLCGVCVFGLGWWSVWLRRRGYVTVLNSPPLM